jgi:redox-sensitive bicupin YhaK (pirin superfamily)
MFRDIKGRIHAPLGGMGPIELRQPVPFNDLEQISPFLLLHHFDFIMEHGENKLSVPTHPHRGFIPITFMYQGSGCHEDSLGNKQLINDIDVQWINAGIGIIHTETAGKEWVVRGGRFNAGQLWINLPKADKMNTPYSAHSDVFTAIMQMKPGSDYSVNFPSSNDVLVYILEGEILVNDIIKASQHDLIYFEHEDGLIILEAFTDAALLIMSGKLLNEPLVSHGPFGITSQTEILEAMKN